jgi:flagellar biosynthesis/type III secretory pathway chaperone
LDWKRLIGALTEEKTVYTELLELADEKRAAVFEKSIERLDAVVRKEQAAVVRLNHWEKQRLASMDVPEGSSDPPTLLFCIGQAPAEEGERLSALHGELNTLLRELSKRNAENKALVESRLEYVQFALDALNAEQSAGLYGSRYGTTPPDSGMIPKTTFDRKG